MSGRRRLGGEAVVGTRRWKDRQEAVRGRWREEKESQFYINARSPPTEKKRRNKSQARASKIENTSPSGLSPGHQPNVYKNFNTMTVSLTLTISRCPKTKSWLDNNKITLCIGSHSLALGS